MYSQREACGSLLYTAVRSTSLVEYLARRLWGRLHLHNSIKASPSLSPVSLCLSLFLSRSLTQRHLCRNSYKDVLPAEGRITFPFTFEGDVIRGTAVKIVQRYRKGSRDLVRKKRKKKKLITRLGCHCDGPNPTQLGKMPDQESVD